MSYKPCVLKVEQDDADRMMNECMELFLRSHPEMKGMKITQRFMFKKLVEFYLNI